VGLTATGAVLLPHAGELVDAADELRGWAAPDVDRRDAVDVERNCGSEFVAIA
jgi:DNA-binding transcriptional LysR family regulator